jgi:PncC family amidohydrolase
MNTLAIAESCTGGLISSLITSKPGASDYFSLGVVTYSNDAKTNVLRIDKAIIEKHGAVSEEVAKLMAENVCKVGKTDIGLAVTGIAGPTGGTKEKPVGTVFVSLHKNNKTICKRFQFTGNRVEIQKKTAEQAINILAKQGE